MNETPTWTSEEDSVSPWARRAVEDLSRDLASDEMRAYAGTAPADLSCIALLGRTQTGKTTVLLHLLGLREDSARHVKDILRGGRQAGESATATATMYAPSVDDRYRMALPDKPLAVCTEEDVREAFRMLRENVERGERYSEALVLHFPRSYFSAPLNVRVFDLPGYDDRSGSGNQLARDLIERYLPHATLRLLVTPASKVSELAYHSVDPATSVVGDWLCDPLRHALVLTSAASDESTCKLLVDSESNGEVTKELSEDCEDWLARHHRSEIVRSLSARMVPSDVERFARMDVFVVDAGDSWDAIQGTAAGDLAAPMLERSRVRLQQRMTRASSPTAILTHYAGLVDRAKDAIENLELECERDRSALETERKNFHREIEELVQMLGLQQERLENAHKVVVACQKTKPVTGVWPTTAPDVDPGSNRINTIILAEYIDDGRETVKSCVKDRISGMDRLVLSLLRDSDVDFSKWREKMINDSVCIYNEYLSPVRHHLNRHFFTKLIDRTSYVKQTRECYMSGVLAAQRCVENEMGDLGERLLPRAKKAVRQIETLIMALHKKVDEVTASRTTVEMRIEALKARHEQRKESVLADAARAEQFQTYLDRRYAEAALERRRVATAEGTLPQDRLRAMADLSRLSGEYDRFKVRQQ